MISQKRINKDKIKNCHFYKDCYSGPDEFTEEGLKIICAPETCECYKSKEESVK